MRLGWRGAGIGVVDADLGLSAAAAARRQGFKDLVARIALGEVGLIVSIEVTRLARNCSDWCPLLDICGRRGCLIADRDAVCDPGLPDGRLLLGLEGTISELELHAIRGRLTAGLLNKARRGELALHLPAGLVRDPSGVVTKDPNQEAQGRVALVSDSFPRLRTTVQVTRALHARPDAAPQRQARRDTLGAAEPGRNGGDAEEPRLRGRFRLRPHADARRRPARTATRLRNAPRCRPRSENAGRG